MDTNLAQGPPIFDPFTPEFLSDPFPVLRRLRTEDPVHRSRFGWVLTRYNDVVAALRNQSLGAAFDREAGRAQLGDGAAFAYVSRRMHNFDPPDHTRLRSLVTKAFTVRRVEAFGRTGHRRWAARAYRRREDDRRVGGPRASAAVSRDLRDAACRVDRRGSADGQRT